MRFAMGDGGAGTTTVTIPRGSYPDRIGGDPPGDDGDGDDGGSSDDDDDDYIETIAEKEHMCFPTGMVGVARIRDPEPYISVSKVDSDKYYVVAVEKTDLDTMLAELHPIERAYVLTNRVLKIARAPRDVAYVLVSKELQRILPLPKTNLRNGRMMKRNGGKFPQARPRKNWKVVLVRCLIDSYKERDLYFIATKDLPTTEDANKNTAWLFFNETPTEVAKAGAKPLKDAKTNKRVAKATLSACRSGDLAKEAVRSEMLRAMGRVKLQKNLLDRSRKTGALAEDFCRDEKLLKEIADLPETIGGKFKDPYGVLGRHPR